MPLSRSEIQKRSNLKRGVKSKAFSLDLETISLFENIAKKTGKTQIKILKEALKDYAEKHL